MFLTKLLRKLYEVRLELQKDFFHKNVLGLKIVRRHVQEGSTIYTDSFTSYLGLSIHSYEHEYVDHSGGEWVRGQCHVNGCEDRVSILRP